MAYQSEVKLQGDSRTFKLSPNLKKYTLMDLGFQIRKNGSFQLERSLDITSPYNQGAKLKVVIKPDFDKFKLNVVTANGLREVDIFKREQDQPLVVQYNFYINQLIEREVLETK